MTNKPKNVVEDISNITTIPIASLNRLNDKISSCICNNVEEAMLEGKTVCENFVGFGLLVVSVENDSIQYKFIPTKKLEKALVDTVVNKKNPLTVKLEETFVNRITKTYKDMF